MEQVAKKLAKKPYGEFRPITMERKVLALTTRRNYLVHNKLFTPTGHPRKFIQEEIEAIDWMLEVLRAALLVANSSTELNLRRLEFALQDRDESGEFF